MNDASTAKYLSDKLGKRLLWRKMHGPDGYEWEIAGAANLRDAQELGKDVNRESGALAAFTESGEAFLLGRVNYDQQFARDRYSPDPFEPGKTGIRFSFSALMRRLRRAGRQAPEEKGQPSAGLLTYQPGEPAISWWNLRRKGRKS
jgi:hypothetical protein